MKILSGEVRRRQFTLVGLSVFVCLLTECQISDFNSIQIISRCGICQFFYTGKIYKVFNFTREKHVNCGFFGKKNKLTMENAFIIYFYQIASFCRTHRVPTYILFFPSSPSPSPSPSPSSVT